jgi:glycosyltransferase involved in cell wall biosynthesis
MRASIIITCYNRENRIARAMRSALSQHFPRDQFEVIVVDDASTDHSREIIMDLHEEVLPIFHEKNMGLPAARNSGIRKAHGRFVLHLDSDDYLHESTLYVMELYLSLNPEFGAVACDYIEVDDQERHLRRVSAESEPIACGMLFRKENLIVIGLYDEEMRMLEDLELRHRFEEKYKIGYCHLPFYRYVRHDGNLTNNKDMIAHYSNILQDKLTPSKTEKH